MKRALRIRGLSGFAREISRMLLRAEDAILDEVLRLRVRRGVDLVDRILTRSRLEADDLSPSQRKAYTFLKRAAAPAQVVSFLAPEPAPLVAGRFHDLAALWNDVNTRYFEALMQPGVLRWSQRASLRRLGFWDFGRDHIVISRSLDHPAVPPEVIQYILFHEGLHRKLGKDHREGGRRFHSRTFRTLERTFPDWRKWEAFLRQEWPKIAQAR